MSIAAIPSETIKTAGLRDSIKDVIRPVREKAGNALRTKFAPIGIGIGLGLGVPAFVNFILDATNKTHGLNQFMAESRKKKQFNDQIELLNQIASNTSMARPADRDIAAEPLSRYAVTPVVPYHQPKRIS